MRVEKYLLDIKTELDKFTKKKYISNWRLKINKKSFDSYYLVKDFKEENYSKGTENKITLTLYKKYLKNNNFYIGDYSFDFSTNTPTQTVIKKIKNSIDLTKYSLKKYYPVIEKPHIKDLKNIDLNLFYSKEYYTNFGYNNTIKTYKEIAELLKELIEKYNKKNENKYYIYLNYMEFFTTLIKNKIIFKEFKNYYNKVYFYLEFAISIKDIKTEKEKEIVSYEKINNLYNYNFEKLFKNKIEELIILKDSKPPKNFKGKVILTDEAVKDFFYPKLTKNPLVTHSLGSMKFYKISKFEKGDKIVNSKKDKINFISNPFLKDNICSIPFDDEGIILKKFYIVKDSIFQNYLASRRFATYLKIEPTGDLTNLEMLGGSKSEKELLNDKKYYIITSFSSFVPNEISGDFSAEIKTGYIVNNGKKTPFKGGLFKGNFFKILEEVELSKEIETKSCFKGPKIVKFYNGEIVGFN